MKKITALLLFVSTAAFGQSLPSPNYATPPQFDASTRAATTNFVKTAGFVYPGTAFGITTSVSLTLSQLGGWAQFLNAAATVTLPALASTAAGVTYTFLGGSTGGTIKGNAAEAIISPSNGSANTFVIAPGENVTITANVSGWVVTTDGVGNTSAFKQLATGQFFQNLGARVNRMNDRLFVGAATVQDGTLAGAQDYVSINIPQGPTTGIAQFAAYSTIGNVGIIGASRSSDAAGAGTEGNLGVMGAVINDATGANVQIGEGGYFEAQQKTGAGFTAAIEADAVNQSGTVVAINPFTMVNGAAYTANIFLGSGGARAGVSATSLGIGLVNNGASYEKGIVFQATAVSSHEDIAMPTGDEIAWWGNATTPTGFVQSTQTTGTEGIVLANNGIAIGNVPSGINAGLFVNNVASAVNFVQISPSTTGIAPSIAASGSDTNIALVLQGQGNGGVAIQGATAGAAAPTGYVGQHITNTTTGVSLTSGTPANVTAVSLTAGDWEVSGSINFANPGTTVFSQIYGGENTASATLPAIPLYSGQYTVSTAGAAFTMTIPMQEFNVTSSTTVNCVGQAVFTVSIAAATCKLDAIRVR